MVGLAGVVVLVLGLISFGRTLASAGKRKGTDTWPRVAGVITSSVVESRDREFTVNIPGINSSVGQGPRIHVPRLQYTYRVGQQDFTGNRVEKTGTRYSNQFMADAVVKRYPVGARVSVAYDPADPAAAVLEVEGSGVARDLAVGALLIIGGAGTLAGWLLLG